MTQLSDSKIIRAELKRFYPALAGIKEKLSKILAATQNLSLDTEADGTIGEEQFKQLRNIEQTLNKFLIAQLFDSK